jgi:prefoldin beta subunit
MTSPKIEQLQLQQQNLQSILMQKQQIESQLIEINSAINELGNTDKSYKIIGRIMIASNKETLNKELNEKKEVINLRLKNISEQEEKINRNIESLQKEVVESLKNKE